MELASAAPKRFRVTGSGGNVQPPPSGAGVAHIPYPPASTQTSPGKQSPSCVHGGIQKLANATQSSFVSQRWTGSSPRLRVGLHLKVVSGLASVPVMQSASVSHRYAHDFGTAEPASVAASFGPPSVDASAAPPVPVPPLPDAPPVAAPPVPADPPAALAPPGLVVPPVLAV